MRNIVVLSGLVLSITGCGILLPRHVGTTTSSAAPASKPVAEAKPPDSVVHFVDESSLREATKSWAEHHGRPPPTVLRVYPLYERWGMQRSDAGIITGRFDNVAVFARGGETGKCYQFLCNLVEPEENGSWGAADLSCEPSLTLQVTCSSVDALPPGTTLQ